MKQFAHEPFSGWIRFLGAIVFGDALKAWNAASDAERDFFLLRAKQESLQPLLYFYLRDSLPENERVSFGKIFHLRSAGAMIHRHAFSEFEKTLAEAHVRYCPIKGLDLAYDFYPDPALRFFTDWDILIHPSDCEQALRAADDAGWSVPYLVIGEEHHHFDRRKRNGIEMEIHRSLPRFPGIQPLKLWTEIHPAENGGFRHVLSPELNLLLQTRHAASDNYMHIPLSKLLLDSASILKKQTVDFERAGDMARGFSLPLSANLLAAWPEFFPESMIRSMNADPRKTVLFRKIFLSGMQFPATSRNADFAMNEADVFSVSWLEKRFSVFRPERLRAKYKLTHSTGAGLLLKAYLQEIILKCFGFFKRLFAPNFRVRSYLRLVRSAEKNGR